MPAPVPNQIAYLEPVFAQLAKFDAEDLGDDNPFAMDMVQNAIKQHMQGMEAEEASGTLERDSKVLEDYSKQPDAHPAATYVYGVYLGMMMFGDISDYTL
jgi:hypothetical protein